MATYRITVRREVEQTHDIEVEADNEDDARDQGNDEIENIAELTVGTMASPHQTQRSPRWSSLPTRGKKSPTMAKLEPHRIERLETGAAGATFAPLMRVHAARSRPESQAFAGAGVARSPGCSDTSHLSAMQQFGGRTPPRKSEHGSALDPNEEDEMTDSKLNRMAREEKARWLKSCGAEGGSLSEFQAHLVKLMETDSEWRSAAIEHVRRRNDRRVEGGAQDDARAPTAQGRRHCAGPRRFRHRARHHRPRRHHGCERAKTKAQRVEADRLMMAAEEARERAGGDLDTLVRNIKDQVWPARDTRRSEKRR